MNAPAAPLVQTFMTHRMTDAAIRALATGREQETGRIMEAVRRSLGAAPGALQHVAIYGPRGFGKSFVARLVQIETADLAAARGVPIPFVLLPEEQHNLTRNPHALPAYIAHKVADLRTGEDRSWAGAMFQWPDPEQEARQWDEAVDQLERELDLSLSASRGMGVVVIENFDVLLASVFKEDAAEQRLRKWLDRPRNRIMLIATATGSMDMDYDRPLFQAFQSIRLEPWSQDTCIRYFNRRREAEALAPLDAVAEAKARAVADFIGGNPRLAQLLANVLETQDALSVAGTMNALADKLADYYRRRIDDLPALAQGLFDALIRGGEPASQTELAQRVGADGQSTIARVMQDLQRADIIRGLPALDGRETLYRVTDRVFAYFYRLRQGQQLALQTPLATILDFLRAFYSRDEQRAQAMLHLNGGQPAEARLFADLAGDVKEPAQVLRVFAVSLDESDRLEECISTHLQWFARAQSVSDGWDIGRAAAIAIMAAAYVSSPEAIDVFAKWVEWDTTAEDGIRIDWRSYISNLCAASARARTWDTLDKLIENQADRLAGGYLLYPGWSTIGAAIVRTAAAEGRAAGFEAARGVLPRVVRLCGLLQNPDLSLNSALSEIVSTFARDCRDAGLIRDVAGLLTPELDLDAPKLAFLLRVLAQVDEAKNPQAVLARMDPDIALWMRRIRDLPEPTEKPRRRRTRNG